MKRVTFRDEATGVYTGDNILHIKDEVSDTLGTKDSARLPGIKEKLLSVRAGRVRPAMDD